MLPNVATIHLEPYRKECDNSTVALRGLITVTIARTRMNCLPRPPKMAVAAAAPGTSEAASLLIGETWRRAVFTSTYTAMQAETPTMDDRGKFLAGSLSSSVK
jgi:hypothetical protein